MLTFLEKWSLTIYVNIPARPISVQSILENRLQFVVSPLLEVVCQIVIVNLCLKDHLGWSLFF